MKPNQRIRTAFSALILLPAASGALLMLGGMGGCQLFSEQAQAPAGPIYPDSMTKGEIFDVQVFRQSTTLRLTNTTTRDFGPSTVWLNQRYSSPIDALASGETIEMDLKIFVDEFGETYRAGGFFSQRVPAPVVLCQLETDEGDGPVMHGFVVVENAMD